MLWQAAHFLKTFSPSAAFVEANIAKIFPESEFVFEEVVLSVEATSETWYADFSGFST